MLQLPHVTEQLLCHNPHQIAAQLALTVAYLGNQSEYAVNVDEENRNRAESDHGYRPRVVWKKGVYFSENTSFFQLIKLCAVADEIPVDDARAAVDKDGDFVNLMIRLENVFAFVKIVDFRVEIIEYLSYVFGAYAPEEIRFSYNINIPVHNCVNNLNLTII